MQLGQSVAQKVTITGLPRNCFRVIFFPVIVVKVESGASLEDNNDSKKNRVTMRRMSPRLFFADDGNCSITRFNLTRECRDYSKSGKL